VRAYTVYITPQALREVKALPGHVRQRVRRAVDALAHQPRPPRSKALDLPDVDIEARRIRLGKWRILYLLDETDHTVDVLAVRKRPPYDYGDLEQLLASV
jgi:mRNA interferase RelE/StbE